jgi:hypothetical protein
MRLIVAMLYEYDHNGQMQNNFPGGKRVASADMGSTVETDQSPSEGGNGSAAQSHDLVHAVEDRILRVHPWKNELYLVSASVEVRSA